MVELGIYPNDGDPPIGGYQLLVQTPPGQYSLDFQLDTSPSEDESWSPGLYNATVFLCEGTSKKIKKVKVNATTTYLHQQ